MSNKLLGAEIFSTGTHNSLDFSDSDLDAIVTAFDTLGSAARVPLKFGHNDVQPLTDGQPALGWVQRVWKDGSKLLADFVDVPTVVFDAIKKGLYKNVSVELLQNFNRNGTSFPWVLDAVALLGADKPAVRDLKDLQALAMASNLAGAKFASVATFTQASTIGDKPKMTEEEMKAQIDAANKRADDLEKKHFAEKVEAHRVAVKSLFEDAVKEGRILPRVRDRELGSRLFKDDQEVLTAYSLDTVKLIVTENQRADFTEKKGPTSKVGQEDKVDLSGKTNAEVVTFKAQAEAIRLGQDPLNSAHLSAATKRLFTQDQKLARAYFDKPHEVYTASDAA
jgi:hypothetical protein